MLTNKIKVYIDDIDTKAMKNQENQIQVEAYKKLEEILDKNRYKIKEKDVLECRAHNSIFLDGKRGSGKTQFILSIKKHFRDSKILKDIFIFNPIDPTLLHENESFLTIIIAKILNKLESKKSFSNLEDSEKKSFYKTLSDLANAIDGVISNKNDSKTALETIAQDQNSLNLEQLIHDFLGRFVIFCLKIELYCL